MYGMKLLELHEGLCSPNFIQYCLVSLKYLFINCCHYTIILILAHILYEYIHRSIIIYIYLNLFTKTIRGGQCIKKQIQALKVENCKCVLRVSVYLG